MGIFRYIWRLVWAALLPLAMFSVQQVQQQVQPALTALAGSRPLLLLEDLIAALMIGLTAAVLLHGLVEAVRERLSAE